MRPVPLLFSALIFNVMIGSCNRSENGSTDQAEGHSEETTSVPVEVHRVMTGDIASTITSTGTIQPYREAYVAAEAAGRILDVAVEVGDGVQSGELLVQVDDELLRLAVDQAEAQTLQTKATFTKAVKDLERHEKLYADGSVTEFEVETARVNRDVSESGYLLAEAGLRMARRQLADSRILSPISGMIAERMVDVGETVTPGTRVVKIVDIERVKVKIGLSEEQIVNIHTGQQVTLTVDAYPGISFDGKVFTVGPEASSETRTFPVEIVIRNPENRPLKSGMVARVDVAIDVIEDVPVCPRDAILERAGVYIAFVVNGTIAQKRVLELGAQSGTMIEIRRGIAAGEDVVVIGQENLSDGTSVSIQNRRDRY